VAGADAHPTTPPRRLAIPARSGPAKVFSLSTAGATHDGSAAVSLDQGIGTLWDGAEQLPLVLYYGLNFSGFDLGCGLAFAADRLVVVWLYCRDGELAHLWLADTGGRPLVNLPSTGACHVSYIPKIAQLALPAIDLPLPATEGGFRVTGPAIDLRDDLSDGTTGRLRWGAAWLPAWVFEVIDCRDCGGVGWWELHLIAYDGAQTRLLSIIAYLFADRPNEVLLGWGAWLPDLSLPQSIDLAATWTVTWVPP